jgi:hypothetical protein
MSRRAPVRHAAIAVLAATSIPAIALAQTMKPGDVSASTSLTGVNQFNTDLDRGGDFRWATGIVSGTVARQFTREISAGFSLRYDYEAWTFGNPVAFGGKAPWENLNAPNIAASLTYAITPDVLVGFVPSFGWSFESGAKTGDALVYGAILSATKVFSPGLALGIGASIVHQIDENKVFPFLIIQWQIDERWRLANPFRAGPAGGAGLELAYMIDDNWEIAGGGAYRSYRFRLKDSGPTPAGIGENRFFPVFARLTRKFGAQTKLDFYAGVSAGGRLSVDNAQGNGVASDDYKTAPAIGLTLSHRY